MIRAELRQAEIAILNAPFEDRGWERATESIVGATRSSGAHFVGVGGPMVVPLNVTVGNYAGYEDYFTDPQLCGASNWRFSTTSGPMTIQYDADYATYRAMNDTADYDDAVSDLDIPFGCQSALLTDSNSMVGLALFRGAKQGACNEDALRDFAVLNRQLARAVRMQIALDGEAAELMVGNVGALDSAVLLLDRHGSLCALTRAAEPLLEEGGPLRLDGLAVRLRNPGEDRRLQQALGRLLRSDGYRDTLVHQSRIGNGGANRWHLSAMRLPERPHGLGFDPHLAVSFKAAA